jgi:endoribonuclease Dicer
VTTELTVQFLGDVAEAALGAIFEDSGHDLEACRSIYEKQFKPFMDLYCVGPHEHPLHPKSVFLEMMSGRGCTRWKIHNHGANPGPYVTRGESSSHPLSPNTTQYDHKSCHLFMCTGDIC